MVISALLWAIAVSTTYADTYWYQLLQADKPSAEQIQSHGLTSLPFISRTTYAGWSDGHELPPTAWYENLAANLVAPHGWAVIDHEDWPMTTQAERLATAQKFATMFLQVKAHRPDVKFGFYGYAPKRDLFRARTLPGHPDYIAWQAENDDMAAMAAVVDAFFPTLYYFYNVAVNGVNANLGVQDYYRENIRETKRLRDTYGDANRPIWPYIWWKAHAHEEDDLDDAAWLPMIEISFAGTNGCVLWGGWQRTWAEFVPKWNQFIARLPKRVQAGHYSRPTKAAGQW
jgi:hypothetical protein